MDELERHLRELASHRADQVPAFDPASLTAPAGDGRGRRWPVMLVAAAVVLALVVGGGWFVFRDEDTRHHASVVAPPASSVATTPSTAAPTTTVPSNAAAVCANADAGMSEAPQRTGGPSASAPPFAIVVGWARDCLDEVAIQYFAPAPGFSARYEDPPVEDGGSAPVRGSAFIVLRVDASRGPSAVGNDDDVTFSEPFGVQEVRRLKDDAAETWVVGLDRRRPFRVSNRDGQVVVTVATDRTASRCSDPSHHYGVVIPQRWFLLSGGSESSCKAFVPTPGAITLGDPPPDGPIVQLVDVPFDTYRPPNVVIESERETVIDGRRARVVEGVCNCIGGPARYYEWAIDWGEHGTLTVFGETGSPTPYDDIKTAADDIAQSARFVP
jgi:hypothetical protein